MKEYFLLQLKMTNRKLSSSGINPTLAFILMLIGFIGLSIYLFSKTDYAEYVYILIALRLVSKLSEINRNDFLKMVFEYKMYLKLRVVENIIIALPFIIFLTYKQLYPSLIVLIILSISMALINFKSTFNFTIPTPFYKYPFEFSVGFRSTFYLFFFAYFLTFMAVSVGNFSLGAFALMLIFLVTISFYSKPENEYYVWSFKKSPRGFLFEKIKIGIIYSTILSIPVLLALGVFFRDEASILFLLLLLGYVYLIAMILAKYSAYPLELNIPQGILFAISLLFPPLLIGVIPFFYLKSINRLNAFLE